MAASPYDPMDPRVRRDPYPSYRELRRSAPVAQVESTGFYAVARHRDVVEVLRSPDVFSSRAMRFTATNGRPQPPMIAGAGSPPPEAVAKLFASLPFPPAELALARNLIATDGPDHNDMRAIVNRGFTPRRIAELEPRIRAIARSCLAEARRKGELDLVADLAIPLPVTVIAELLGVDPDRRADFKRWSDTIVASAAGGGMPGAANPGGLIAFAELFSFLASVIEERRRAPREDLVSILVRAEDGAAALRPAEVLMFALLLLVAGNETTTNLLGNALLALTDHPAALARVQRDRALVPALIEEVLRYDSPVQLRPPPRHPRHGARRGSARGGLRRRAAARLRESRRRRIPERRPLRPRPRARAARLVRLRRALLPGRRARAARGEGRAGRALRAARARAQGDGPDRAGRLLHAARPAQPPAALRFDVVRARTASARSARGTPPPTGTSARLRDRRRRSRPPSRA